MKMTISRALKEKNRIAGRISKLQKQVEENNRYDSNKTPDFDSCVLLEELQTEWAHLIDLKTKIAKANVGIADKLIQLTEAKAELTFWNNFHCAGQASESYDKNEYISGQYVTKKGVMHSSITSKQVIEHRERVQKLIENLQDDVDDFNSKTII